MYIANSYFILSLSLLLSLSIYIIHVYIYIYLGLVLSELGFQDLGLIKKTLSKLSYLCDAEIP